MSVAITTQPATSVQVNKTSTVTATVTNDSSNAGVDWTLACGGSGCGSITTHTASAAPATFTAPSSVPSAVVVITAKSAADATKTANANSITIAGSGISIAITSQPASALQVNTHTTVTALVTAATQVWTGVWPVVVVLAGQLTRTLRAVWRQITPRQRQYQRQSDAAAQLQKTKHHDKKDARRVGPIDLPLPCPKEGRAERPPRSRVMTNGAGSFLRSEVTQLFG